MRGTFTRLDERLSEIESFLLAQDEKFKQEQVKMTKAFEVIMKWMIDNKEAAESKPIVKIEKSDESAEDEESLAKKVEDLSDNVKGLRRQIGEMMSDKESTSKGLLEQTEKLVNSKLASADEVISKIEEKLTHFYVTGPLTTPAPVTRNNEWEDQISQTLQDIRTNIDAMTSSKSASSMGGVELDREFFETIANQTLESIEDMKIEVLAASDKSFTKTATRIKEAVEHLDGTTNEVLKTLSESESNPEVFQEEVRKGFTDLKSDILALGKLENILLQTADNVLSIKRGMEFNVHAITLEIEEVVKTSAKDLNSTFYKRFDALNETILSNHNGALSNLTSKIETEISQVWRQIGIMYQEVSSSKDALNKLQEQTEAYVNGTFTTMDSMEGKVSQITGRMAEVDSNLNYLLGRLSLVTQEFNQIKTGLGSALDNIRSSFQIVQNKIQDVGPGPHKIPEEEDG
ncbi:hypothetical protein Bhyg_16591 [Pseudolycoriella hygida]|uniref:Uncharacterized protein n=1 Tax=Pseudolycoriella hygida TaxID=35572 RepID=A0A9Q0RVE3_9DIPT|nr:hypothetical protein Bhyg_16591 [Pseudolycoriella hygida]